MAAVLTGPGDIEPCTSDGDCNGGKICTLNECRFSNSDPCLRNPCKNEGICKSSPDGTYFCDCPVGYIAPNCEDQDPCLLEGNMACRNGATCSRINNFQYDCNCRFPYNDGHCDSYNLCELDEGECVEDLNRDSPTDSFCFPCKEGANCTQISKTEYLCACEAGINHESCYEADIISSGDLSHIPGAGGNPRLDWNPIIPTIAVASCCLYFLFLLLALLALRKTKKRRLKLIVCANIHDFDNLSYYLISVETRKGWKTGAQCDVFCSIKGDRGQAGPFPLNDFNLRELDVLQSGQEDNYLVSNIADLGSIKKIMITCSPLPGCGRKSWSCQSVTVRNIKTEETCFFRVSKKLKPKLCGKDKSRQYEFCRSNISGLEGDTCCRRIAKYHAYLCPLVSFLPENVTLASAEWMTYMIFLITFYGFLPDIDKDFHTPGEYKWSWNVLVDASITAGWGFLLGTFYALFFLFRCKNEERKRIPTLLVLRRSISQSSYVPPYAPCFGVPLEKTNTDHQTPTSPQPAVPLAVEPMKKDKEHIKIVKELPPPGSGIDKAYPFRIPSTDIMETEKWVYDTAHGTAGPEELAVDHILVQTYSPHHPGVTNLPEAVLDYGFIGALTDIRQQKPKKFVYQTSLVENENLRKAIDSDIRIEYEKVKVEPVSPQDSEENLESGSSQLSADDMSSDEVLASPPNLQISKESQESDPLAAGDFLKEESKELKPMASAFLEKHSELQCELCEVENPAAGPKPSKIIPCFCMFTGWVICTGVIIAATVICCIYGARYGLQRTYDWCISLAICLVQNFLIYQFIKILVLFIALKLTDDKEEILRNEKRRIRERFQVFYVKENVDTPIFPLQYVEYLPTTWAPILASPPPSKTSSYLPKASPRNNEPAPQKWK